MQGAICQLEEETGVKLDNHSSFGSTVVKGFGRLEKFLEQGRLGDFTLIEFGGNDCAYDWAEVAAEPEQEHLCVVPPEEFEKEYARMIHAVEEAGSVPVAATLPPISSRRYLAHVCRDGLDSKAILHWLGDLEAIHRWQAGYSAMVRRVARAWAAAYWICARYSRQGARSRKNICALTASTPTGWGSG